MKTVILLLFIALLPCWAALADSSADNGMLSVYVDSRGHLTGEVSLSSDEGLPLTAQERFLIVGLPFPSRPNWVIATKSDIDVYPLHKETTFSLFGITARTDVIQFTIQNLKEIRYADGKAILQINNAFEETDVLQKLYGEGFFINTWEIRIILPDIYDDIESNVPFRQNNREIVISSDAVASRGDIVLKFPDPRDPKVNFEVLVAQWWLAGIVALLLPSVIGGAATRVECPWCYIGVGVLAGAWVVYCLVIYSSLGWQDFLSNEVYRASAPGALMGSFVAFAVAVPRLLRGRVKGKVSFRGKEAYAAKVRLCQSMNDGTEKQILSKDLEKGEYTLGVWFPSGQDEYVIRASIPRYTREVFKKSILRRGIVEALAEVELPAMAIAGRWTLDQQETERRLEEEIRKRYTGLKEDSVRELRGWMSQQTSLVEMVAGALGLYKIVWGQNREERGQWEFGIERKDYQLFPDGGGRRHVFAELVGGRACIDVEPEEALLQKVTLVLVRDVGAEVKDAP